MCQRPFPTPFVRVTDSDAGIVLGTVKNREDLNKLLDEAIANGRSFKVEFTNNVLKPYDSYRSGH